MDFGVWLKVLSRSRIGVLLCLTIATVLLAAWLAYLFGGRQPVTTGFDVGISVLRLMLPLLVVFSVQDLVFREFERKHYCMTLSYPVSRSRWLLMRFMVLALSILMALLFVSAALSGLIYLFSMDSQQGTPVSVGSEYWVLVAFIAIDLLVLLSVSMLLSTVSSSFSFVFVGFLGFLLISRSYAGVIDLLTNSLGLVGDHEGYSLGLSLLRFLIPDLGGLDVRMIALYGEMEFLPETWFRQVVSAGAYSLALLTLNVWLLQRKRLE